MSRMKCEAISQGGLPSERVAQFKTADGHVEEVIVYEGQASNDRLDVAALREVGDRVLIELPRESSSGSWRMWAPKASIVE